MNKKDFIDAVETIEWQKSAGLWQRRINWRTFSYTAIFIFIMAVIIVFSAMDDNEINKTWGKAKVGDRLFADDKYLTDASKYGKIIDVYRKMRRLNASDINKLDSPQWVKTKMIAQLNTSEEYNIPMMAFSEMQFVQDTFYKKNSALVGTYLSSDSVSTSQRFTDTLSYSAQKWLAIKLNKDLCVSDFTTIEIPGFTFADSNYYVQPRDVKLFEPATLKALKKGVSK